MSWNFRVIEDKRDQNPKYHYCFIAEVYYDKKNNLMGYTHKWGVNMLAEDLKSLKSYHKISGEAFNYPVLNILDFEQ